MDTAIEIKVEENAVSLFGHLNFSNAMQVYKESIPAFSGAGEVVKIDFSGLQSSNSVVLAAIVNWIRLAKKNRKKIHIENVSEETLSLARASGLEALVRSVC